MHAFFSEAIARRISYRSTRISYASPQRTCCSLALASPRIQERNNLWLWVRLQERLHLPSFFRQIKSYPPLLASILPHLASMRLNASNPFLPIAAQYPLNALELAPRPLLCSALLEPLHERAMPHGPATTLGGEWLAA